MGKQCATCSKPITGLPSLVKRRKFCGTECAHESFKVPIADAMNRYTEDKETGCWLWTGSTRRGYGRLRLSELGGIAEAHRVSYELHLGKIPEGLVIDHLCRNRSCINPKHLEPVTMAENIRRGEAGKGPRSEAHNLAVSAANKKRFSDPDNYAAQIKILDAARKSPKRIKALTAALRTPEYRKRRSDIMTRIWAERKAQCR